MTVTNVAPRNRMCPLFIASGYKPPHFGVFFANIIFCDSSTPTILWSMMNGKMMITPAHYSKQNSATMIIGIGNDLVDMQRLRHALARHPRLPDKILTTTERTEYATRKFNVAYLAGRMAAKEALSKAVGSGMRAPMLWRQLSVLSNSAGRPIFHFAPSLAKMLAARGVSHCHLSITHDGGLAAAVVIAENTHHSP